MIGKFFNAYPSIPKMCIIFRSVFLKKKDAIFEVREEVFDSFLLNSLFLIPATPAKVYN